MNTIMRYDGKGRNHAFFFLKARIKPLSNRLTVSCFLIQTHHIRSVSNNQDPWPIEQSTVVFPMAPLQLKENEGTPW